MMGSVRNHLFVVPTSLSIHARNRTYLEKENRGLMRPWPELRCPREKAV